MFWFSYSALRVSLCISAPLTTQGWERQTEGKSSLYSGHINHKLLHPPHIIKVLGIISQQTELTSLSFHA